MYFTNDLRYQAVWLNDFCMLIVIEYFLVWSPIYCVFDICRVFTAIVLIKNDVLLPVPTEKVLELGFLKDRKKASFLSNAIKFLKNKGNDPKPRCSSCIVNEPHNFKILVFLQHGYHVLKLKNIAIPSIVFSPDSFKILPTCQLEYFRVSNPS